MRTKILDISEYWDESFTLTKDLGKNVVIKSITYGEKKDIEQQCTLPKVVGSQTISNPDIGLMQILYVFKGVKDAPFPHDMNGIRNLDSALGEYLYSEIENFIIVSPKIEAPSNGQ